MSTLHSFEKQSLDFENWLNSISPLIVLDQEGRRRLTVQFCIKKYDPDSDIVTFETEKPVKQRFYHNDYFQCPRIRDIQSQEALLTSGPTFLSIDQCKLHTCSEEGIWKFTYSVEKGELEDERWIIPLGFECHLRFLTNSITEVGFTLRLSKWFKRLLPSTYFGNGQIQETEQQGHRYQLLSA